MPWGRSKGRGLGDITGFLVSSPPSPPTPSTSDSFKHSDCASETHHLNRSHCYRGRRRCHLWGRLSSISGYAQRYLSFWLLIHQL